MSTPWRTPPVTTTDYPGLSVGDNCVTGSVNLSKSRLPLWAFVHTAVTQDWDQVECGWGPTKHYGFTAEDLADFLGYLLEQRGEFGRLICVLADVERRDRKGTRLKPWWHRPKQRQRVVDQLRRCMEALEPSDAQGGAPE